MTILLTGATGFIGGRVLARLRALGAPVRCASREPARASAAQPQVAWVRLDVDDPASMGPALSGVRAVVYLVHGMGAGKGPRYAEREKAAARAMAAAAERAGVERIVYLGAVAPRGRPSRHLRSRLSTGESLRAGPVPVFELRAAMVIGHGSLSWRIVRDLAVRLPAMVLPRWLASRSQPVAVDDVVFAIERALYMPVERAGVYELPGPEVLSGREILLRIARLRGTRPLTIGVPLLTPRLSSYWLKFVTGADDAVARELVDGLASDLLPTGRAFWELLPEHHRQSFDEAAGRALAEDRSSLAGPMILLEDGLARLSRRARG
ncbi:MAG: NAD(P)H-binding protein [Myxococcales bacterium]|nr:NAD(P)H-binding protein [Myxococcales bacterium]